MPSQAFMIWKSLSILSASSSPIVVVLSGSMEPAFQRGDLLFLWNRAPRAEIGEVVVYNVVSGICLGFGLLRAKLTPVFCWQRGKDIPIVHRVTRTFPEVEGKNNKAKEITVYVYSLREILLGGLEWLGY